MLWDLNAIVGFFMNALGFERYRWFFYEFIGI